MIPLVCHNHRYLIDSPYIHLYNDYELVSENALVSCFVNNF